MFKFTKGRKQRKMRSHAPNFNYSYTNSPSSSHRDSGSKKVRSSQRHLFSKRENRSLYSMKKKSAYYKTKIKPMPIELPQGKTIENVRPHPNAGRSPVKKLKKIVEKIMRIQRSTMSMKERLILREKKWFSGIQKDRVEELREPFCKPILREKWFIQIWDFYIMVAYLFEVTNFSYK